MTRALVLLMLLAAPTPGGPEEDRLPRLPEFTHRQASEWINSRPLTVAGLDGSVVLIEFWTYDCINCRRTLPWLEAVHSRYGGRGLVIVAVHSPEFEAERDPASVLAAVRRLGIDYPVMLDADFSYWNALGNRFWPAFYLVDRQGRVVAREVGELHADTARGDRFERQIRDLLGDELTPR
jgi:thiol-disulfide isomerase/thioredoxin